MSTSYNNNAGNIDPATVASFGEEWAHYDQSELPEHEQTQLFENYFNVFPWRSLPTDAEGFDIGCGSGRWASLVAPRVGQLHCIDPSPEALAVARRNLSGQSNVTFHQAASDTMPLPKGSQDFGYALGVLHHIPDTAAALRACTAMLKPGAPFLLYLYYSFDNRALWFRTLWRMTESVRWLISRLPNGIKPLVTSLIALMVYLPLARLSWLLEKAGFDVSQIPLSFYRDTSFYTMRTDSRDRFGTQLEQRFSREEIRRMMMDAGLRNVTFSDREPFWCAVGIKD